MSNWSNNAIAEQTDLEMAYMAGYEDGLSDGYLEWQARLNKLDEKFSADFRALNKRVEDELAARRGSGSATTTEHGEDAPPKRD